MGKYIAWQWIIHIGSILPIPKYIEGIQELTSFKKYEFIIKYYNLISILISIMSLLISFILVYINIEFFKYKFIIYDPLSIVYLTFGIVISIFMMYLLNSLFKLYFFLLNKSIFRKFFITILYLIEIFIIISIIDEIYPFLTLGLLRSLHFILLATNLSLLIIKLENFGIKTYYSIGSESMRIGEFKIFRDFTISIIVLWLSFGIASLWGVPIFERMYVSLTENIIIDYFLLVLIILLSISSLYILIKICKLRASNIRFKILIGVSFIFSVILSNILFFDVYSLMYVKVIEIVSFMIFIMFFSTTLDKIIPTLTLSKELFLEVTLKEPKVVVIEYNLRSFGTNKLSLAKVLVDRLIEPAEIGREIDRFDAILIYTIRGSPLIEYLEGNLIHYLIDEEGRCSTPIYTITLTRSLTLPKIYPKGKGVWRYEVGIDPTYTPYVIERIRKEVNSKNMLVIIENPVDLINLIGFKRFYELLHSIIERLRVNDMLIVFTPIDLVDEKILNALRNIAMKVIII